jgi:hypothetical protein
MTDIPTAAIDDILGHLIYDLGSVDKFFKSRMTDAERSAHVYQSIYAVGRWRGYEPPLPHPDDKAAYEEWRRILMQQD